MTDTADESHVDFVGPFEHHEVVVYGWRVPFLSATPVNGGKVWLSLDHRFGLELDVALVEQVVPFIANCIAVGLGYTAHPGDGVKEPLRSTPFSRMHSIDFAEPDRKP